MDNRTHRLNRRWLAALLMVIVCFGCSPATPDGPTDEDRTRIRPVLLDAVHRWEKKESFDDQMSAILETLEFADAHEVVGGVDQYLFRHDEEGLCAIQIEISRDTKTVVNVKWQVCEY